MDKRTNVSRIKSFLKEFEGGEMKLSILRRLIMEHIGSTERTVSSTLRIMHEMGWIQEKDNLVFHISEVI